MLCTNGAYRSTSPTCSCWLEIPRMWRSRTLSTRTSLSMVRPTTSLPRSLNNSVFICRQRSPWPRCRILHSSTRSPPTTRHGFPPSFCFALCFLFSFGFREIEIKIERKRDYLMDAAGSGGTAAADARDPMGCVLGRHRRAAAHAGFPHVHTCTISEYFYPAATARAVLRNARRSTWSRRRSSRRSTRCCRPRPCSSSLRTCAGR